MTTPTTPPANRAETPQVKPKTETWWTIRIRDYWLPISPDEWDQTLEKAEKRRRLYSKASRMPYEVVKVTVEPVSKEPQSKQPPADDIRSKLLALRTEVNCRIEHGADSNGHLKYVQDRLDEILTPSAA